MRKNHESSTGVEDEVFIHPEICSRCSLTCLYIFSINVLKLILNLVSPRFAKDLKELFVCQSNCIFWKGLNHCDWRALLQPMHFHQTLIWICNIELTAWSNVLVLVIDFRELLSGPQIRVSYPYKNLQKQLYNLAFCFLPVTLQRFFSVTVDNTIIHWKTWNVSSAALNATG